MVRIEDTRIKFGGITFSNYKKSDVIKKLINCLYYQSLEETFYWTCELLCSGMIIDVWELYFLYMSKYLHIINPKLPIYLYKKYEQFKSQARTCESDLDLRNNLEIRRILCSISTVLCYSQKRYTIEHIKQDYDFNVEKMFDNLRAPHMDYIKDVYQFGDPKEFFVSFNELAYHLMDTKNKVYIYYWVGWIISYDILCHKKKNPIYSIKRKFVEIDNKKLNVNVIWILWDLFFHLVKKNKTPLNKEKKQTIDALFNIFSIKYKQSTNKKRIYILYYVIELLLENVDFNVALIKDTSIFKTIDNNINTTFDLLKKNETREVDEKDKNKQEMYLMAYNSILS